MDLEELKSETLRIMQKLEIDRRPNCKNDGTVGIRQKVELDNTGMPAAFNLVYGVNDLVEPHNPSLLCYKNPYVGLNTRAMSAWLRPEQENSTYLIEIHGMIIHELTHYYQYTEDPFNKEYIQYNPYSQNYEAYVSQRCELEAHSVQGYYLMEKENPERLAQLMKYNMIPRVIELLVNFMSSKKNLPIVFPV